MLHVLRIKMNFKAYKFNKVKQNYTEGSSNSLVISDEFQVKDKYSIASVSVILSHFDVRKC